MVHSVLCDFCALAIGILDGAQRLVRLLRVGRGIVQLDVVVLGAADDRFLRLGLLRAPGIQVVQVLLHDHVAAAGMVGVFVADDRGFRQRQPFRVGRAIDEVQQVTAIEVAEAGHLVHRLHGVAEGHQQIALEGDDQVHGTRAHVVQQVTRGGHGGVGRTLDLAERLQLARRRAAHHRFPHAVADGHVAGEGALDIADGGVLDQVIAAAQHLAHLGDGIGIVLHLQHQERGRVGQRRGDLLRLVVERVVEGGDRCGLGIHGTSCWRGAGASRGAKCGRF